MTSLQEVASSGRIVTARNPGNPQLACVASFIWVSHPRLPDELWAFRAPRCGQRRKVPQQHSVVLRVKLVICYNQQRWSKPVRPVVMGPEMGKNWLLFWGIACFRLMCDVWRGGCHLIMWRLFIPIWAQTAGDLGTPGGSPSEDPRGTCGALVGSPAYRVGGASKHLDIISYTLRPFSLPEDRSEGLSDWLNAKPPMSTFSWNMKQFK